jgi:protein-tyrosine phosphatase
MSISNIIDNLYICDAESAKNLPNNDRKFIIVNCADELKDMKHDYLVPLYDGRNKNLIEQLDDAYEFINKNLNDKKKIIVHCQAGVSRSAAVIIYYLMKSKNIKYNDAYNILKKVRPIINPNYFFEKTLMKINKINDGYHDVLRSHQMKNLCRMHYDCHDDHDDHDVTNC